MRQEFLMLTCALATAPAAAQTRIQLITESTATVGRSGAFASNNSFIAGVTAVADAGLRWVRPSGLGFGVSMFAGRDFPNEATLVGLRLRLSHRIGQGTLEGAVAGVASSAGTGGVGHASGLGASLGLAYYPASWGALIVQLDAIPTYHAVPFPGPEGSTEELTRRPALSAGIRLAGRTGIVPWLGAGLIGGLSLLFKQ